LDSALERKLVVLCLNCDKSACADPGRINPLDDTRFRQPPPPFHRMRTTRKGQPTQRYAAPSRGNDLLNRVVASPNKT